MKISDFWVKLTMEKSFIVLFICGKCSLTNPLVDRLHFQGEKGGLEGSRAGDFRLHRYKQYSIFSRKKSLVS